MSHPPRIAVVGGGIAGTLCSLVLKNRGFHPVLIDRGRQVGGRFRGGGRSELGVDAGAQFLRASTVPFQSVLEMLERAGLLARWKGNFGLQGQNGGFLPSHIVGTAAAGMPGSSSSSSDPTQQQQQQQHPSTDSGDFCGFVTNHNNPTFVAMPRGSDLCGHICRLADIEGVSKTNVLQANMIPTGGWQLEVEQEQEEATTRTSDNYDALCLLTHDSSLARNTVQSIVDAEEQATVRATDDDQNPSVDVLVNRLKDLTKDLTNLQNSRLPLFSWSGKLSTTAEFDAASVPGSHLVQFLARESSKPGRQQDDDGIWTAISTSRLAKDVLDRHGKTKQASEEATQIISQEAAHLLGVTTGEIQTASAVRWASAFPASTLNLKEDCVLLHPWRLAIGGDFIRSIHAYPTPLEAAAMSGLDAGERMAAMFAVMSPPPTEQ